MLGLEIVLVLVLELVLVIVLVIVLVLVSVLVSGLVLVLVMVIVIMIVLILTSEQAHVDFRGFEANVRGNDLCVYVWQGEGEHGWVNGW